MARVVDQPIHMPVFFGNSSKNFLYRFFVTDFERITVEIVIIGLSHASAQVIKLFSIPRKSNDSMTSLQKRPAQTRADESGCPCQDNFFSHVFSCSLRSFPRFANHIGKQC